MSLSVNKITPLQVSGSAIVGQGNPTVKADNKGVVVKFTKDNFSSSQNMAIVTGDPFNDGRKILNPTGAANGRNFYFLYTQDHLIDLITMRTPNKLMVQDDIARLRAKGYTVIIDNKTTTADFKNAAYDQKAFGIVSLGHGGEGTLVTVAKNGDPEGDYVTHWDIDSKKVSPNLKMVYLQACQAGMEQKGWEKAFKTDVVAWEKSVSNVEMLSANGHIATAGIFPVIGAYFSIQSQLHGKALADLIKEKF